MAAVKAVGTGKVAFINLAIDITNLCDCTPFADVPILPDLGVFASYDPVSLDKACVDKTKKTAGIQVQRPKRNMFWSVASVNSRFARSGWPGLGEETQLNVGEINGLGTRKYQLVPVTEKKLKDVAFPPDPRPAGIRYQLLYQKLQPFPYNCYDGKGFLREETVDLKLVNSYHPSSKNLSKNKTVNKK